jgi:NAD(P)-dependent dehydrogenase (short-subunit alcohol dehydrogenase family)
VDPEAWHRAFQVNTIAPLILTQKLLPQLRAGKDQRLAYLSSKRGSIADNTSGASYVYRSTKSALNQVVKSLSEDLRQEGFIALALHPGWVRTDMGGPNGLIDTQTSASGLLSVIEEATAEQSGMFLSYDGSTIKW